MGKITSKDVAREAGVSQTTVSLVMNGRNLSSFSEETQRKVWAAAKHLGYFPSTAAKALRTGRNDIVFCLIPDFPSTTAMDEFKTLLSTRLAASGLVCVFFHFAEMAEELETVWARIRPAVVISFIELPGRDLATLQSAGIPCINGIFSKKPDGHSESGLDQEAIGVLQVQHLVSRGYQRIIFVGVQDVRETFFCTSRLRGVQEGCRQASLPAPEIYHLADYDREEALTVVGSLSQRTGVAAFNDLTAMAVLAAAQALQMPVPERLGIIGVDNLPVTRLTVPMLTTIELNLTVNVAYLTDKVLKLLALVPEAAPANDVVQALTVIQRETS